VTSVLRSRAVGLAAVTALLIAATTVVGTTTAAGAVPAGAATGATAVCAGPGARRTGVAAGTNTRTLAVGGEERAYRIEVPASYRPSKPAPLLFDFHGLGSNKEQQALYAGLEAKGGAAGYVVITPDGSGGVAKRWVPPPIPGPDLAFVQAMLDTTERELCIDARRVDATGISSGAVFSTALACALPGTFAAIAPVAGVNGHAVCAGGAPKVSVLAFHGTADGIVPYAGGRYFGGVDLALLPEALRERAQDLAGLTARPVMTAIAEWAAFDGCATSPTTSTVASDVTRTVYPKCAARAAVELYTVEGGGHTWPGAPSVRTSRLGPTTQSIDASALMLRFFTAHPRDVASKSEAGRVAAR
jgi:polyhydroxybutyrate depolymerase